MFERYYANLLPPRGAMVRVRQSESAMAMRNTSR
jgi:hypothetical protein